MVEQARFAIENELCAVGRTTRALEEFLCNRGVEPNTVFAATLGLEEALTNVMKYAYDDGRAHTIDIEAAVADDEITIGVADDGRAFDPLRAPPPDRAIPLEARSGGGVGIHLMRSFARRADYVRAPGKNVLTLAFARDRQPAQEKVMPLHIDVSEKKAGLIEVILDGRLDTETAPLLEQRLAPLMAKAVVAMRFDMQLLRYMSSMGIRVLFNTFKALRAKKAMFLMIHLQPQIRKVLDIAQALPSETVFASVQEADAYYDAMQRKALGKEVDA